MRFIEALADAFIATFGITQPTQATRRKASYFILGLLLLTGVAVLGAGVLLHKVMR